MPQAVWLGLFRTLWQTQDCVWVGLLVLVLATARVDAVPDMTAKVEVLGNPFMERYATRPYARNVWDMQTFKGRIYVGSGNSSNLGPDINAGPVDVWSVHPQGDQFVKEHTLEDEQIAVFRIIGGKLYIPGHDPLGGLAQGHYYVLETTGWVKHTTLPASYHTYDMYGFGGKLFAALGTDMSGPSLVMSHDGGRSWHSAGVESPARFYTLFELDKQLSASPDLRGTSSVYSVYRFAGTSFQPTWPKSVVFPQAQSPALRVTRPTNFQDQLVYIAGIPVNDHQWVPAGLYRAQQFGTATPIRLPNQAPNADPQSRCSARPWRGSNLGAETPP